MNRVGAALSVSRIRTDLTAVSKEQVLEEAGRLFASYEGWEPAHITQRLAAREAVGSTGLGHGVAIPHARLKGLRQAVAAFIRPQMAVAFGAPDGKPVSEFLVLLVPDEAAEEHLQMLAQAAAMFEDRGFRERLRAETDAAGILRAFLEWPPERAV
jgi:PTS system nitrogen regulatory IIA component